MTAFQEQIAEDAGKWSKGGRGTFLRQLLTPPGEEPPVPLKELSHTGTAFLLCEQ